MSSSAPNSRGCQSPTKPLVYRAKDYIGGFRHLVIFAVDFFVILIVARLLSDLSPWLIPPFAWGYLAVLKPSRFRTPGYWITDAKIITLEGQRPSPFRMTQRLLWMVLWGIGWPISFYLDWLWTTIDDDRQMLRDLYAETRLVRNSAAPLGTGRISYVFYTGLGLTLTYARVQLRDLDSSKLPVLPEIEAPTVSSERSVELAVEMRPHDGSILLCPKCGMRVIPKLSGHCPSCQTQMLSENARQNEGTARLSARPVTSQ